MTLTPKGYRPRLLDALVLETLTAFGAVSIEGPKYCGKTWTALNHAESAFYTMNPEGGFANRHLAAIDPASAIVGNEPRLLDEWQVAPGLWDAVRFAVDRKQEKGRFILTGSVTPMKEKPLHSGTGRIAKLPMRPMTLFESGLSSGSISLSGLFAGDSVAVSKSEVSLAEIALACVVGGWPENLGVSEDSAMRMASQYLASVQSSDISAPDNVVRDARKVGALLRALARNNATMVSNTTLKWDVSGQEGAVSTPTIAAYLNALRQVFVLEEIPGWAPTARARSRARVSPKRYLVDPSLVTAALGIDAARLLGDLPTFGMVFEGLCVRDIQVYAQTMGATLRHYHDEDGVEVDVIVERQDGSYGAIEVKLNAGHEDIAAESLARFTRKMKTQGINPPVFCLVLTGSGLSYQRNDGVAVAPITALRN